MNPTQLLAGIEVSPAELLRAAKHYVATFGWHQGAMFADFGLPCPPACAAGAIRFAVMGETMPCADEALSDGRADRFVDTVDVLAWYLINTGAVIVDDDSFTDDMPYDVVAGWNDDASRNVAHILAALNGAADEWDRLHPAGDAQ